MWLEFETDGIGLFFTVMNTPWIYVFAALKLAASSSRASANYIAAGLLKRLQGAKDWMVGSLYKYRYHM